MTTLLAFIGAGRMAEALISGLISKRLLAPDEIVVADIDPGRLAALCELYSVMTAADNSDAVRRADFVLLAVKPQHIDPVVTGLRDALSPDKTIISIAAGVTVARLRRLIGFDLPIVRVMPNAPALVNQGISGVAFPPGLAADKRAFVDRLLESAGAVIHVDESDIDAVTAVSGSGPAYFFLFVRELARAGTAAGLDSDTALALARQTFIGSAALMARTGLSEDDLIRSVASPGGTTEAALDSFSGSKIENIMRDAVLAALVRAKELA